MIHLGQQMDSIRSFHSVANNDNINDNINLPSSNSFSNTNNSPGNVIPTLIRPIQSDVFQYISSVKFGNRYGISTTSNYSHEEIDEGDQNNPEKKRTLLLQQLVTTTARGNRTLWCVDIIDQGDILRFEIDKEYIISTEMRENNTELIMRLKYGPICMKNITDWSLPNQNYDNYKWKPSRPRSFLLNYFKSVDEDFDLLANEFKSIRITAPKLTLAQLQALPNSI